MEQHLRQLDFGLSKVVRTACHQTLLALVRVFYRLGIGPDLYVEMSKKAYAEMLMKDAKIDGKPPSKSRIAMLMRVKRDVVTKLLGEQTPSATAFISVGAHVINRWENEPQWLDENSQPRVLNLNDFKTLCLSVDKRYPHSTIAQELEASGCIKVADKKWFKLTGVPYSPQDSSAESVSGMLWRASAHIKTIAHNIESLSPGAKKKYWIDRVIHSRHVRDEDLVKLREKAPQVIHSSLDDYLELVEGHETIGDAELNSVVIGVYYAEIPLDEKNAK